MRIISSILLMLMFVVTSQATTVNGTVQDAFTGGPVAGAFVALMGNDPATGDSSYFGAVSDSAGYFEITAILPGEYVLFCSATGYQFQSVPGIILDENTPLTLQIALYPLGTNDTARMAGTVYTTPSLNSNEYQPLAGAQVTLEGEMITSMMITGSNGEFEFDNLQPGYYILSASAPGHFPQQGIVQAYLNPGDDLSNIGIVLVQQDSTGLSSLNGTVTDISNGQPVFPADVFCIGYSANGDSAFYFAGTDPAGYYDIPFMQPGFYNIHVYAEGYQPSGAYGVQVIGAVTQDIALQPLVPVDWSWISGRITSDEDGQPIPNVHVEFLSSNQYYNQFSTVSDADGYYHAQLPAGDYYVSSWFTLGDSSFYYQEFYDDALDFSDAQLVTTVANDTLNGIDFGLPVSGNVSQFTISGRVTDDAGTPLAGAQVSFYGNGMYFYNPSGQVAVTTDEQGMYEYTTVLPFAVPYVAVTAGAGAPGYMTEFWQEQPVYFLANQIVINSDTVVTGIDFTLTAVGATSSISGQVTGQFGEPLANTFVLGAGVNTDEVVFAITDPLGNYFLPAGEGGSYYLVFAEAEHIPEYYDNVLTWEEATPITVNGAVTGINAQLSAVYSDSAGNASISGLVHNPGGQPLASAMVAVSNALGEVIAYDMTGPDGTYQLLGSFDGDMHIHASKVNYSSVVESFDFNSQAASAMVMDIEMIPVSTTGVETVSQVTAALPTRFRLLGNYPNPFNPETTIRYELPTAANVEIAVYNMSGAKIAGLVNGPVSAGQHEVRFDGSGFASGVYLVRLRTANASDLLKVILLK